MRSARRRIINIAEDSHFADYAEPGRIFEDQEYFARTAPRPKPGIFRNWWDLASAVILVSLGCMALYGFGTMVWWEFFKRIQ